ncbi:uncharacterized protein At5g01610-like [Rutidosis leptorrhynchoides]|uniref:uncharacterized protein At5g01610-like n=1 Tax=Rutidosis leptorrhynchoides TaxID=125765 RepID=UPI003A99197C
MASSQVCLILLLALITISASASSATPSIYDKLREYGLPPGILPDSVSSYSLDKETSIFEISLKKECYVKKDYLVYFAPKITGKISKGQITELYGVQVQTYVLWIPTWVSIYEIKVFRNKVQLTVPMKTVDVNIADFEEIPTCQGNSLAACNDQSNVINPLPLIEAN